jgi:hypothetical protein
MMDESEQDDGDGGSTISGTTVMISQDGFDDMKLSSSLAIT